MSTYYEYQDVKRIIVHELFSRGWNVYEYHEDRSDSMTDYYDPEYWGGVAEKNGYILCVNCGERAAQEIKEYVNKNAIDNSIYNKIEKLSKMTIENGATVGEVKNALKMIEILKDKLNQQVAAAKEYVVTGIIPGNMANPPRCNWHLEKDGKYILKGNGILKYSRLYKYLGYDGGKALKLFINDVDEWEEEYKCHRKYGRFPTDEDIEHQKIEYEKAVNLYENFMKLINKIDNESGNLIGESDKEVSYETVTKTEYKTENKVVKCENGELKDGQCFVLNVNFTGNRLKGYVYRLHKIMHDSDSAYWVAYRLNEKLTKERHGTATTSNRFGFYNEIGISNLKKWIGDGSISWCNIETVRTPYEVQKVVKKAKYNKVSKDNDMNENMTVKKDSERQFEYECEIRQDVNTRTQDNIFVMRIVNTLSMEDYKVFNAFVKSIGGYYSKFKHGFIFKENPQNVLNKHGILIKNNN